MVDPTARTLRTRRGGFTLIEVIVAITLMALLAGAAAPVAMQQVRSSRLRTTQERMQSLVVAMVGDPARGDFGYVGDVGALPAALVDLNTRDDITPIFDAAVDPNDGISTGWAGPYVPLAANGNTAFVDSWGNPFVYAPGVGAQITSNGPDGQPATGDELMFPAVPPDIEGSLTVVVRGVANDTAGSICQLDGTQANVRVFSAVDGSRDFTDFVASAGTFVNRDAVAPFGEPDELHNGLHGILVEGQGNWSGVNVRGVAEVYRSTTTAEFQIYQPAGPPPGCP